MKLEEQMFKEVADWINSGQIKRDFIKDKDFSAHKFNYWIRKYQDQRHQTKDFNGFKEVGIPHSDKLNAAPAVKSETSRKIEITTPSGFVISIVEEC